MRMRYRYLSFNESSMTTYIEWNSMGLRQG
jgi:hypothetical protein